MIKIKKVSIHTILLSMQSSVYIDISPSSSVMSLIAKSSMSVLIWPMGAITVPSHKVVSTITWDDTYKALHCSA